MFANVLLLKAITSGDPAKFHAAIERGADLNFQGGSPLRLACKMGREHMFAHLLERVDLVKYGEDALVSAIQNGCISMVSRLLDRGVDANGADGMPLRLATSQGREDMVKLLLEKNASATHRNCSAFGIAATLGYVRIAEMLIAAGADPFARDGEFVNAAAGAPMRALFEQASRRRNAA